MKKHWKGAVFFIFFILFLVTKEIIFAGLTLVTMILMLGSDVQQEVKKYGWKHEIIDTVISIIIVLVFWFGLQVLLNSSTPVSVIVTCSMLPELDRGDLVLVQGTSIETKEINMSKIEFENLNNYDVLVHYKDSTFPVKGSIYSYCKFNSINQDPVCNDFIKEPEEFIEQKGDLKFHYSMCNINYLEEGVSVQEPCVTSMEYGDKEYEMNLTQDKIVYTPEEGTYFSYIGDIIHRAQLKINVDGEEYYLAKGDNNQLFDIQIYDYDYDLGNLPAKNLKGREIFKIPYVGYLKLFISGYFNPPTQCNTNLIYPHLI